MAEANGKAPRCDKCDGEHETETCPFYPNPPENHIDATMHKGEKPMCVPDTVLPFTVQVIPQEGDGNCAFHAMAHIINKCEGKHVEGTQLRAEAAEFIHHHKQLQFQGKTIQEWIEKLERP